MNGYLFFNNYSKNVKTADMQAMMVSMNGSMEALNAELVQKDAELEALQIYLEELDDTTLDLRTEHRVLENKINNYENENTEIEEYIENEK